MQLKMKLQETNVQNLEKNHSAIVLQFLNEKTKNTAEEKVCSDKKFSKSLQCHKTIHNSLRIGKKVKRGIKNIKLI